MPRSNGSIGSTTAACWSRSATCHRPKPKRPTTGSWRNPSQSLPESNETASEEVGTVQLHQYSRRTPTPNCNDDEKNPALEIAGAFRDGSSRGQGGKTRRATQRTYLCQLPAGCKKRGTTDLDRRWSPLAMTANSSIECAFV